ncbi:hypothetical protein KUTeg_009488 [Tegillarca granosa]|uniref:Uncharacterized protein n=1 Tax=Tegillarca granosa TaxID=220873 RepID=A0ABQ9F759_TEGGR|nr:hypothetical protein KUTeg_009488 [Tegillarca granosa]
MEMKFLHVLALILAVTVVTADDEEENEVITDKNIVKARVESCVILSKEMSLTCSSSGEPDFSLREDIKAAEQKISRNHDGI